MTTTVKIVHTTGFEYSSAVSDSFNEVRMSPAYTPEQLIRERNVSITPHPWSQDYIDYWGSQVTAFEIHEPHKELTVKVTTSLDVSRSEREPSRVTVADVADDADRWNEYLTLTPAVDPGADLAERARAIALEHVTVDEIGLAVGGLIHDKMEYVSGSTHVASLAAETWDAKKGVCQDYAHLMIGALRHVGVPARYVSGYVMPRREAPIGKTVLAESHAWVQWWNGEWFGFDPTNNTQPTDVHVQVGTGREYSDVAPLRGLFTGKATSEMFVQVEMTRLK